MNNKLILTLLIATILLTALAGATTITVGGVSSGNDWGANQPFLIEACSGANSGTASTIGANLINIGSGSVITGIYSDSANAPVTLLGASASASAVNGWNDGDISANSVSIAANTCYFLAEVCTVGGNVCDVQFISSATPPSLSESGAGGLPASWSGGSALSQAYNMRFAFSSSSTSTTSTTSTSTSSTSTSSTTSTSTSVYTTSIASTDCAQTNAGLLCAAGFTFNISFIGLILSFLVFGLVWVRTKDILIAIFMCAFFSVVLYATGFQIINLDTTAALTFMFILTLVFKIYQRRTHK